jgi:hypothetical protein
VWSSYGAARVRSSGKTTNFCCCPRNGFKVQQAVSTKAESPGFAEPSKRQRACVVSQAERTSRAAGAATSRLVEPRRGRSDFGRIELTNFHSEIGAAIPRPGQESAAREKRTSA